MGAVVGLGDLPFPIHRQVDLRHSGAGKTLVSGDVSLQSLFRVQDAIVVDHCRPLAQAQPQGIDEGDDDHIHGEGEHRHIEHAGAGGHHIRIVVASRERVGKHKADHRAQGCQQVGGLAGDQVDGADADADQDQIEAGEKHSVGAAHGADLQEGKTDGPAKQSQHQPDAGDKQHHHGHQDADKDIRNKDNARHGEEEILPKPGQLDLQLKKQGLFKARAGKVATAHQIIPEQGRPQGESQAHGGHPEPALGQVVYPCIEQLGADRGENYQRHEAQGA